MKLLSCILTGAVVFTACGESKNKNASTTKDIATDLPDSGANNPVYRYWVQDGKIARGLCDGREILVASNCSSDVKKLSYDVFKIRLNGGLTNTAVDLFRELMEIESAVYRIEKTIDATSKAIVAEQQRLGATNAELEATKAELAKVSTFVAEYKVQLAKINVQLRVVFDADLHEQGAELAAQLDGLRAQLGVICDKIPDILARIKEITAKIDSLKSQLNLLSTRLRNLKIDHDRVMQDFEHACQELAIYHDTIEKLTSGIIYRVMSDNDRWQAERRFIKRFDRIFAAHSADQE